MTAMSDRYDRAAERYEAWWAPVLRATAVRVLDRVEGVVPAAGAPARILDLGTGTGTLAQAALRRWPTVRVTAVDASRGMLDAARRLAGDGLAAGELDRLSLKVADAGRLPFADEAFDAVVSSFVLQLVPDRMAALREVRRVLRPDGVLAFVTWMVSERTFEPDEVFFDVVDELDVPDEGGAEDDRTGDFASVREARDDLRTSGFRVVSARQETLDHQFEPARYIDFLEHYGEYDLFRSLSPRTRTTLRARTQERLATLPASDFRLESPVVMAVARRPAR